MKKQFKLKIASDIVIDMTRQDIRYLCHNKSTGFTKWDVLLSKIKYDNVTITRMDDYCIKRKHSNKILCGFVKLGFFKYLDFVIEFDTIKNHGYINMEVN